MRSKKAIYNIVTNLVLQVMVLIYGFLVPKLIISKFGSAVNGLSASITQFLAYITLLEAGFGPVVKSVLYKPIAKHNTDEISSILKASEKFFRIIAYIFLAYIVILAGIYPFLINNEFGNLYTVSLLLIISVSTFVEYYFGMTYTLFLQADQKNYIISIIRTITYIINIGVVLILIRLEVSIHLVKAITGIIFIARPIIQNIYVKRKYKINLKNTEGTYKIKQKWEGLAQHIAYVIHTNTDITLLTIFCSLSEVSVYSVYTMIMNGIKNMIQVFSNGIDSAFGDMIAKKEKDNLSKKFNIYEIIYFTITAIACISTMILIVPFVQVYTRDVTDTDYIRYTFAYLLVIGEFIWLIRQPYNKIIQAAGHFKQTRNGAWVEALSNIGISIILIFKLGIIGVAIGTAVAMTIRTIEFVYHTNKYIIDRKQKHSIGKILLVICETVIVCILFNYIPLLENNSYYNWLINALIVGSTTLIIVVSLNFIFYRKEFKELIAILKNTLHKSKKINK